MFALLPAGAHSRNGWTPLHTSYGRADLEWDVPMPLDARFEIGSLARQFTAVAVVETPQGPGLPRDGSPPRAFPWVEGHAFRAGGDSGPVTELRDSMPGGHYLLKKQ